MTPDRHVVQARVRAPLRTALAAAARRHGRSRRPELVAALERHLARLGLWPFEGDGGALPDGYGPHLRELRLRAGLTQSALAGRLGLSQATVSAWERGLKRPGKAAAGALAGELGVPAR